MEAIKPKYYELTIKGTTFDVFDLVDAIEEKMSFSFRMASALGYIIRKKSDAPEKRINDLEKAAECLNREIEYLKAKNRRTEAAAMIERDFAQRAELSRQQTYNDMGAKIINAIDEAKRTNSYVDVQAPQLALCVVRVTKSDTLESVFEAFARRGVLKQWREYMQPQSNHYKTV